jgi:hypothetical protein
MTDGISIMGPYRRELYFLFSIMGILQQGTIILSNTDDYKRKNIYAQRFTTTFTQTFL